MKITGKGKLFKYFFFIFLAAVLLSIIGYRYWGSISNQIDGKLAVRAVRGYNEKLIDALGTLEIQKLQGYVTEKQSTADELFLAYYKEKAKVRELDQLTELKVNQVTINKDSAEVMTSEIWRVKQESLTTGKITDMGEVSYKTTYSLVRQSGKWVVDSVKPEEMGKK